ncbi:MAG: AmmeMemoRadiSam system protein B [Nanobdellota archaeon]
MKEWFPTEKEKLERVLDSFLSKNPVVKKDKINGIIVPHAGYSYSGEIAGEAFSLLKDKNIKKAIIFGPSHYQTFKGISSLNSFETPLGKITIPKNNFNKIPHEHSIENQIPFLQKLGIKEILPLAVGHINMQEAEEIAKQFINEEAVFIFSTDLSHSLEYNEAVKRDKSTIEVISNLKEYQLENINACGLYPLLILFKMCQLKGWKPKLIDYKNSGDITGDTVFVVGYASFYF